MLHEVTGNFRPGNILVIVKIICSYVAEASEYCKHVVATLLLVYLNK